MEILIKKRSNRWILSYLQTDQSREICRRHTVIFSACIPILHTAGLTKCQKCQHSHRAWTYAADCCLIGSLDSSTAIFNGGAVPPDFSSCMVTEPQFDSSRGPLLHVTSFSALVSCLRLHYCQLKAIKKLLSCLGKGPCDRNDQINNAEVTGSQVKCVRN